MIFERNHCYKVTMNNNPKSPKIIKVESIDYLK